MDFSRQSRKPKHNWANANVAGERKNMLDMKRAKYFGFDLRDMLAEFALGENTATVAATLSSRARIHSIDDAVEYINQLKASGTLDEAKAGRLEALLRKYSRWR
jgi:hypothetical protein